MPRSKSDSNPNSHIYFKGRGGGGERERVSRSQSGGTPSSTGRGVPNPVLVGVCVCVGGVPHPVLAGDLSRNLGPVELLWNGDGVPPPPVNRQMPVKKNLPLGVNADVLWRRLSTCACTRDTYTSEEA